MPWTAKDSDKEWVGKDLEFTEHADTTLVDDPLVSCRFSDKIAHIFYPTSLFDSDSPKALHVFIGRVSRRNVNLIADMSFRLDIQLNYFGHILAKSIKRARGLLGIPFGSDIREGAPGGRHTIFQRRASNPGIP